jgi:hypothetical protein
LLLYELIFYITLSISTISMNNTWITAAASLLMLTLAMILGVLGKPTEMGLIVVAGAISIAFLNIDRIQRFKGAGFEAEMRQAVEQAHATVEQLRTLAAASAESTLTTLMAGNFMGGTTLSTRLDLHDRLIKSLEDIGVPQPQIDEAERMWKKGVGAVYHRGIHHCLEGRTQKNNINLNADPAVLEASKQFQDLLKFENWEAPSSSAMTTFIEGKNLMSPELAELLSDYSHFEQTGKIKRRDVFVTL